MNVVMPGTLLEWEALEDSPSLKTIRKAIEAIPDAKLLAALRAHRGRGRNDYPVHVLWGTLLLKIMLRHTHMEDCLAELRRNRGLREVIGIEGERWAPKKWNMTRFVDVLGTEPHLTLLRETFGKMIETLSEEVEDLGKVTSGDATHLSARPARSKGSQRGTLPAPAGGKKEYIDGEGNVVKVIEWFGYNLHLLIDVPHEVVLSWRVASPKADETEELKDLVEQAEENLPDDRIETLTYDRACDDGDVHEFLNGKGIRPVIENRQMWTDDPERMLPGHDGRSNIVYDESGTVHCYDKVSDPPIRRRMSYIGYEKGRGTLKYRCPAKHEGFRCRSDSRCNAGKSYGKTVRIKCALDFRRFPPIPRSTKGFERMYKGRSACERVNGRLKLFWGIDDANTWGAERFHAEVGAIMVVHLAFARLLAEKTKGQGVLCKTRLEQVMRHKPKDAVKKKRKKRKKRKHR